MPRFEVIVTQYHSYEVEAENETEAEELGLYEFDKDMRYPVAHTQYDEIEVNEIDGE